MHLLKLHGLGNDFLVLLDDGSDGPVRPGLVRALCSRHTGVGADGLIRSERVADGTITFELRNADGSTAEMSGNGARCLGLAAARSGWWADRSQPLVLVTPAGERRLDWLEGDLLFARLRVGMGAVGPFAAPFDHGRRFELQGAPDSWRWMVDVGNPHWVSLFDGKLPPLEELEAALGAIEIGGATDINYEFVVRGPQVDELTMVVRERGAGWTQACGTGSVAAAWAAHQQGWVGDVVTVHNPGGTVRVELAGPEAMLIGPAVFVATVEVPQARAGGRP
jgi:diaminopimelate epimerase